MKKREQIKVITLYVLFLLAIGLGSCKSKKNTVERVTVQDSVSFALPGRTEISLKALCDTLTYIKTESGPVKIQTVKVEGDPRLVVQYDTIFKEKIRYVDKVKEVETVRNVIDWRYTIYFCIAAFVIGVIRPWRFLL